MPKKKNSNLRIFSARGLISIFLLSFTLALTACVPIDPKSVLGNLNLALPSGYEEFQGTFEDYGAQPVELIWTIDEFDSKNQSEYYSLSISGYGEPREFEIENSFTKNTNDRSIDIRKLWENIFLLMAAERSGTELEFSLTLFKPRPEGVASDMWIKENFVTKKFKWIRPEITKPPVEAKIYFYWDYEESTQACIYFRDQAIHQITAFPFEDSSIVSVNGKGEDEMFRVWTSTIGARKFYELIPNLGVECFDRDNQKVKMDVVYKNTVGVSKSSILETKSIYGQGAKLYDGLMDLKESSND